MTKVFMVLVSLHAGNQTSRGSAIPVPFTVVGYSLIKGTYY